MVAGPDRDKALDLALAQIDKQFGKGSVMRLGERPVVQTAIIPTGSIALDVALGVGGLPRGRVIEIYGPESSGKTTVALHAVASGPAASPRSSTPSTPSTRSTRRHSVSTPTRCWCPSPTRVSRRSRSPTC
jgi:RecA/RadA recombinase